MRNELARRKQSRPSAQQADVSFHAGLDGLLNSRCGFPKPLLILELEVLPQQIRGTRGWPLD